MEIVLKLLLTKLVDVALTLLVKKAEVKFAEAKSGTDKKAYVLKKLDAIFDIDDEAVGEIKEELIGDASDKIDAKVTELFNKDK